MTAALAGSRAPGLLLERGRELAALRAAIGEAVGGRGWCWWRGSAGVGKTRLLGEARRHAGVRVLVARGGELEREFAFGVVRQLFERQVAVRCLGPAGGGGDRVRGVRARRARGRRVRTRSLLALLHGLSWLTVNLAGEAPLVIVVYDLHWCDGPSLRFLAYLVRRLKGLPVLVLGSVRPSERRGDSALLGEIAGDPLTVSIHPGPLSEQAAIRLVRERLGEEADESFALACHTIAAGNPLLLHELLRTLVAEGVEPSAAQARRSAGALLVSNAGTRLWVSDVQTAFRALRARAAAALGCLPAAVA